jgi:hypothetical protein
VVGEVHKVVAPECAERAPLRQHGEEILLAIGPLAERYQQCDHCAGRQDRVGELHERRRLAGAGTGHKVYKLAEICGVGHSLDRHRETRFSRAQCQAQRDRMRRPLFHATKRVDVAQGGRAHPLDDDIDDGVVSRQG